MGLTCAASPSRSMCLNHVVLQPPFPIVAIKRNISGLSNISGSGKRITRKSASTIKALNGSSSKQTLSSNWDVSQDYSASSSPWQPRFEELDTANTLLRQRIIFLGSQVSFFLSHQNRESWVFILLIFWISYWISEMGFAYCWVLGLYFFCWRCMEVILDVLMALMGIHLQIIGQLTSIGLNIGSGHGFLRFLLICCICFQLKLNFLTERCFVDYQLISSFP